MRIYLCYKRGGTQETLITGRTQYSYIYAVVSNSYTIRSLKTINYFIRGAKHVICVVKSFYKLIVGKYGRRLLEERKLFSPTFK